MRIVIAEDSVLLREGLARLLSDYGDEVVASVGDAEEAKAAVAELVRTACLTPATWVGSALQDDTAVKDWASRERPE